MVFFVCNICNESLKKKQVEKHFGACRRCSILSCVDCNVQFNRQTYADHFKCISEEAKYNGPNYQAKPSANKGEKKQEAWTEQIQAAIDRCQPSHTMTKQVLLKIRDAPNVPRKKVKFENFVKNIFRYVKPDVLNEVWNFISIKDSSNGAPESTNSTATQIHEQKNGVAHQSQEATNPVTEAPPDEDKASLSKRDRKKARREQQSRPEKKDERNQDAEMEVERTSAPNKRLRDHEEPDVSESLPRKKSKRAPAEDKPKVSVAADLDANTTACSDVLSTAVPLRGEGRLNMTLTEEDEVQGGEFRWTDTIRQVVSSAQGSEIKLNRLKKKVLAAYAAHSANLVKRHADDARVLQKFQKKLDRHFVCLHDRVKLKPEDDTA